MALTRGASEERKFERRREGSMKKVTFLYDTVSNIEAAVFFLDKNTNILWKYETKEGWVSSIPLMENLVSRPASSSLIWSANR